MVAGQQSSTANESATSSEQKQARILWADDNADMSAYVARLLGPRFDLDVVSDGHAALNAARARKPDLVLTDVMIPGMDGFGLLRSIRSDPRLSEVPVILLSARAGEEARIEGLQAGADDYLTKPFSSRELIVLVESQIEPLRTFTAYSQLLERDFAGKFGERGGKSIHFIVEAASRMQTLLRDLSVYTRVLTADEQTVEEVDASAILQKALQNLEEAIQEGGAVIAYAQLPRVRMHAFQPQQVFQNRIANAIRYRRTEPPRVGIAATCQGKEHRA